MKLNKTIVASVNAVRSRKLDDERTTSVRLLPKRWITGEEHCGDPASKHSGITQSGT